MFASHPLMKERIDNIEQDDQREEAHGDGDGAGALRQEHHVRRQADDARSRRLPKVRAAWLAAVATRSRLTTRRRPTKATEAKKEEEPKKCGGMLEQVRPSSGSQAQQSQTVASAGARGVVPDRDAVGGSNKNRVTVKIGPSDIAEFQKGIVA